MNLGQDVSMMSQFVDGCSIRGIDMIFMLISVRNHVSGGYTYVSEMFPPRNTVSSSFMHVSDISQTDSALLRRFRPDEQGTAGLSSFAF